MKLALMGYGAMGQLVARLARDRGDGVDAIITSENAARSKDELAAQLSGHDVAIDFSVGAAVPGNVAACVHAGVPLVEGTTGWLDHLNEVRRLVDENQGALVYGANFSVGVQVFYRLAARAGELFHELNAYDAFIEEAHHKRKRDAPSGTALHVQQLVQSALGREVPVVSTRAGYIPGAHRVGFDSAADQIVLSHEARNREGFAAGALLAAGWIAKRKGCYEFSQVFDEIVSGH